MRITSPGRNRAIIADNERVTQEVGTWMQLVSGGAQTLEGDGTPEGFVEGQLGWDYFNRTTFVFYKKSIAGGKTGWIALNDSPLKTLL